MLSLEICPPPITCTLHFEMGCSTLPPFVHALGRRVVAITTPHVACLIPRPFKEAFEWIVLPDGQVKTAERKLFLEERLLEKGCGRDTCLVAVGGGTLLDLVGFVAATYCRGIPYLTVPTTLLAMTDAAIGGKTGVDVRGAKNYLGAFHHPLRIYIDTTFLHSLPKEEIRSGRAEMIKHALIGDADLFTRLEQGADASALLQQSCAVKCRLVQEDPFETKGRRQLLNFGHTVGHAVESASDYTIRHGEAVAFGLFLESHLSCHFSTLQEAELKRIEALLAPYDLDHTFPLEAMDVDKKIVGETLHVPLLQTIGKATCLPVSYSEWKAACSAHLSSLPL